MRIVVQRVSRARISIEDEVVAEIRRGLLVLLGITKSDVSADAEFLANKISKLRIFDDGDGKMNLAVNQIGGEILVVSQFTLYADTSRGARPSFIEAAPAEQARELYEYFIECIRRTGLKVQTGRFQANMQVELVNDGPVTIIIDSRS